MEAKEFGEHLQRLRTKAGFPTRESLYNASGVWNSTIKRMEEGKIKSPSPQTLRKLAPFLNVSPKELMEAAGYISNEETDIYAKAYDDEDRILDLTELSEKDRKYILELVQRLKTKE